jgi:hypothetical protein
MVGFTMTDSQETKHEQELNIITQSPTRYGCGPLLPHTPGKAHACSWSGQPPCLPTAVPTTLCYRISGRGRPTLAVGVASPCGHW